MKVLVTGASGFLGRALVTELLAHGHMVSTLHRGAPLEGVPEHTAADVLAPAALEAVRGVEGVVHLAGRGDVVDSFKRPEFYHQLNAVGTLAMLGAAREQGAAFVLASSQRVYRPREGLLSEDDLATPSTPYGYSKLIAETWVQSYARLHGVRGVVVRIFSAYGPAQTSLGASNVVTIFMRRALHQEPLIVTGTQRQDFVAVEDAVSGLRLALERGAAGERYNLATGIGTSVLELAHIARDALGSHSTIEQRDAPAHDGDLVANIDKARGELGYDPRVTLAEGLRRYAERLRLDG